MAAAASYSAEEVERAIQALYGGQNVAEADRWLTLYVASPAAWEISIAMITSSPHMQVRFFAANALHQKVVKGDVDALPPDAQAQLLGSLLSALHAEEQQQLLTKLSLALVALGLIFTKEDGKLKAMLLDNPAFLALRPRAALEFFLLLPQEWDDVSAKNMTRSGESRALQQLALLLPQVVSLIQSLLASAEDQDMLLRSLQALAGWCKFGISLSGLRQLPFYSSVKELLRSPTLCKGACELFEAAMKNTSYPEEPEDVLLVVVEDVIALQPLFMEAKAQRNDSFCEGPAILARALIRRHSSLMTSGRGSTLQLAQFTLEMVAHPHKAVSETAMEYWDEVDLVEMHERHEAMRGPIYHDLVALLATRSAPYPAGFVDWDSCEEDEEEFHMFRRRIADSLLNCCICLRAESLAILCRLLSGAGAQWEAVEAVLFSIAAIGGELVTQDQPAQRQQVLASVSELLSSYIFKDAIPASPALVAHCAALNVVRTYVKCLAQNTGLIQPSLEFVVRRLPDGNIAEDAAKAFAAICSQASNPAVTPVICDAALVQALVQQVVSQMGSMERAVTHSVVESFGRLISHVERHQMLAILQTLIAPFTTRLRELVGGEAGGFVKANHILEVAACISLVGAAVRFLECGQQGGGAGEADSQHPVGLVLQTSWDALDACIVKFPGDPTIGEALCDVYAVGMKQAKDAIQGLLPSLLTSLVNVYRSTRASKCLEVAGVAVELFGKFEQSAAPFQALLQELNGVSFEAAQAQGLDAVPDLIEAHFTMLTRYAIYCPRALVTSPSLPTVLELAKAGVPLANRSPLMAIISFLQQLVEARQYPPEIFESHVAPWFGANGQALVTALVMALADTADPEVCRARLPLLFYTLNGRFGAAYQEWLRAAVATAPLNDNVDAAVKDQFLKANVNVEHNRGRFQALLQDFSAICRKKQTADALLSYQLA